MREATAGPCEVPTCRGTARPSAKYCPAHDRRRARHGDATALLCRCCLIVRTAEEDEEAAYTDRRRHAYVCMPCLMAGCLSPLDEGRVKGAPCALRVAS